LTVPDANLTIVGTATTQTLTNKTLTAPTINNGSITGTTITTDAIVGQSASTTGTVYGVSVTTGTIGGAGLASGAVTFSKVATGFPVQVVGTDFSAVATGTTIIPFDDTIPQITEGIEFMTQAITPKSATNTLYVDATIMLSSSVAGNIQCAIFQDATANALAAIDNYELTATAPVVLKISLKLTAGTTSSTTFRMRAGSDQAGTTTFNGSGGVRKYGGITISSMRITEVAV
jgi:hypothetical protein